MFPFNLELTFLYALFLFSLLSIFLTFWVVWRVEKKLDISYKFFLLAIIVFSLGIFFEILQFYQLISAWLWGKIFQSLFIIFFTAAMMEMHDLILELKKKFKDKLKDEDRPQSKK